MWPRSRVYGSPSSSGSVGVRQMLGVSDVYASHLLSGLKEASVRVHCA